MTGPTRLPLVAVEDLRVAFRGPQGWADVLHGIDLALHAGEVVGLVGESGSGKSVTAFSLMGLLPKRESRTHAKRLEVCGVSVIHAGGAALRDLRGANSSMVFQEPLTALNPIMSIRHQLCDVIRRHQRVRGAAAMGRARSLLADMLLDDPDRVLQSYPHQLSGGMRQRVLLAMAFSCQPKLLIADEPTTALDVTVQAQILSLIRRKADETGVAVLFVTHDLAVVSQLCDRVCVMHAGRIVEEGPVRDVIDSPQERYTRELLAARPERHTPRTPLGVAPETTPGPAP